VEVIAYLRVSTDRQAQDGYGLIVQLEDVQVYAKANGHEIIAIMKDEGVSGTKETADREALPEALLALQPGQGLLIPNLTRLSRDLLVQEQILRDVWAMGCEVVSTLGSEQNLRDDPDDPGRRMMRQILGSVSEYQRASIVLRLKKGRKMKAKRGGFAYGSPHFGTQASDHELVDDTTEQAAITRIRTLRSEGLSLRAIACTANAEGIQAKHGGVWYAATVRRVLVRAA
jgi:DNA invertase Pin-like site-specific DNA recombinase